jgi:hypothetical protein
VEHKDRPTISLYFDKKTGLMVKTQRKAKSPEMEFKEVNQETFLTGYKDFGGVKMATKILIKREGKKYIEAEITDFKFSDKAKKGTFDKP